MLRLGHITYSNCFPVHARFIDEGPPEGVALIEGVPSHLNRLLVERAIDVAPCSSIEYARHADRYRLMPQLVIGSAGPIQSILLVGRAPSDLDRRRVGVPTASATSVVLLKILCRVRWHVEPVFFWFDQGREDPFAVGADAALFIGDIALQEDLFVMARFRIDLAAEWFAETSLPFAFALWQVSGGDEPQLVRLLDALVDSREYWRIRSGWLADRYAARFGQTPEQLRDYWRGLQFDLSAGMIEGIETFYRLATDIGELPAYPKLVWV